MPAELVLHKAEIIANLALDAVAYHGFFADFFCDHQAQPGVVKPVFGDVDAKGIVVRRLTLVEHSLERGRIE